MERPVADNVNECRNVFASDPARIGENFMQLWLKVICEKEDRITIKKDRQTISLEL